MKVQSRQPHPGCLTARARSVLRRALLPLLLLLGGLPFPAAAQNAPAAAAPPARPAYALDVSITVFSFGPGTDRLGVGYHGNVPKEVVQRDLDTLAAALGQPPPKFKLTRVEPEAPPKPPPARRSPRSRRGRTPPPAADPPATGQATGAEGVTLADAEMSGLTDWTTGEIHLDPIIQAYQRYGHFNARFLFMGKFPLKPLEPVHRGPLRVEMKSSGSSVDFEVWVDQQQRRGAVPLVKKKPGFPWLPVLALGVILLVVLGAGYRLVRMRG